MITNDSLITGSWHCHVKLGSGVHNMPLGGYNIWVMNIWKHRHLPGLHTVFAEYNEWADLRCYAMSLYNTYSLLFPPIGYFGFSIRCTCPCISLQLSRTKNTCGLLTSSASLWCKPRAASPVFSSLMSTLPSLFKSSCSNSSAYLCSLSGSTGAPHSPFSLFLPRRVWAQKRSSSSPMWKIEPVLDAGRLLVTSSSHRRAGDADRGRAELGCAFRTVGAGMDMI